MAMVAVGGLGVASGIGGGVLVARHDDPPGVVLIGLGLLALALTRGRRRRAAGDARYRFD
jgi:hypothetical protein